MNLKFPHFSREGLLLLALGSVALLVVALGVLHESHENDKQSEQIRRQAIQNEKLEDCKERLIVNVEKRSTFSNQLREIDKARTRVLLEVANEPDPQKRRDLFFSRNHQLDVQEQAVVTARDKFPLPKLDECKN